MHVININVFELHKSQSLFELSNRIEIFMRERFGGNEKVLSFASSLFDHLFNSITKGYLIIV